MTDGEANRIESPVMLKLAELLVCGLHELVVNVNLFVVETWGRFNKKKPGWVKGTTWQVGIDLHDGYGIHQQDVTSGSFRPVETSARIV